MTRNKKIIIILIVINIIFGLTYFSYRQYTSKQQDIKTVENKNKDGVGASIKIEEDPLEENKNTVTVYLWDEKEKNIASEDVLILVNGEKIDFIPAGKNGGYFYGKTKQYYTENVPNDNEEYS